MSWAIFELTNWGEKEQTSLLRKEIFSRLGDVEIFIPFLRGKQGLYLSLVSGYVFVDIEGIPEHKLFQIEDTKYVKSFLTETKKIGERYNRQASIVSDDYVMDLQEQFRLILSSGLVDGDVVTVRSGLYRHLSGKVLYIQEAIASVFIELKTLKILIDIPTFNLIKVDTKKKI